MRFLSAEYPSGRFGVALLLLRVAAGAIVWAEGWRSIAGAGASTISDLAGIAGLLLGGSLLIGYLTALTAAASLAEVIVLWETWVQGYGWRFSRLEFLLLATILLAIMSSGPGRISLDARLFGRRLIILPDRLRVEQ